MTKFDFISGADFRKSLEEDYRELNLAMEIRAWKAVHVLAGSIIEALLTDSLVSVNYQQQEISKDPLHMSLEELIIACTQQKILSKRTEQISHAIRSYRNLIHPGRTVRLNESADEEGAKVAQALVNLVINEVTKKRKENYGYTAEQIATKIENDTSTVAILGHLLSETKNFEKERLLIDIIPKRYNILFSCW